MRTYETWIVVRGIGRSGTREHDTKSASSVLSGNACGIDGFIDTKSARALRAVRSFAGLEVKKNLQIRKRFPRPSRLRSWERVELYHRPRPGLGHAAART